ncbi:hypothetical protein PgNI_06460 [Pyricularia grisea]|uniref:Uncharacterized protein n=1 Tax=Pyricularia grisea TaxID=148305 RepID=A0A6P8B7C1_PYRGI|nr:hypothetical protein PgNI_06460 [Pyricularia grisea]TLD11231.1 hypothetical protein PgNI_06460 [Pyricularia grisea]
MKTRTAIHFAAAVYYAQIAAGENDQHKCVDATGAEVTADRCKSSANPGTILISRRDEPPVDSDEKRALPKASRIKRGGFGTPTTLAKRHKHTNGSTPIIVGYRPRPGGTRGA